MLSGQRAFRGDTAADTITAILTKEPPDLSQTNKEVHPGPRPDRSALPREEPGGALRVGARRRVRPGIALERLDATGAVRRRRSPGGRAGSGRPFWPRSSASPRAWRPDTAYGKKAGFVPPPNYQQLTFRRGEVYSARFAPDGQTVIYAAAWDGRPVEVFATRTDRPESRVFGLVGAGRALRSRRAGEMAVSLDRHIDGPSSGAGRSPQVGVTGGVAPREISKDVEWADWGPDGTSWRRPGREPAKAARISRGQGALPDRRLDQPSAGFARREITSPFSTTRSGGRRRARSRSSTAPGNKTTLAGEFSSE